MIDGHGDDLHQYEGKIKYNFSSNVYYKGCANLLLDTLQHSIKNIQNYPSPIAHELNVLAAKYHKINSDQLLFCNGATEAFYLIAQKFRKQKALIASPTFSEYEDACKINQLDVSFIDRDRLLDSKIAADLIFICNPNNPNGAVYSLVEIEKLLLVNSASFFIVDEAYIEFTNKVKSSQNLIEKYNNLAIVKSLTKTFAIPGLRLGYVISNVNFITDLLALKMPWSVNSVSIAAGKYIFNNYSRLQFSVNDLLKETQQFQKELNEIDYIEVQASATSYFLVQLLKGKTADLKNYLAIEHQILIRDATNFKGLEGEFIRLSTQGKEANKTLINALKSWN